MIRTELPTINAPCHIGYGGSVCNPVIIRKRGLVVDDAHIMMSPTIAQQESPLKKRRTVISNKKRVRFTQEEPEIRVRHMSDDDLQQAWYSPAECARFKQDTRNTINAAVMGGQKSNDSCLRGLEHHLSVETMLYHKQRRRNFIFSILNQQQMQRQLGMYNNEISLRMISFMNSKQSRDEAVQLGALDAMEV